MASPVMQLDVLLNKQNIRLALKLITKKLEIRKKVLTVETTIA